MLNFHAAGVLRKTGVQQVVGRGRLGRRAFTRVHACMRAWGRASSHAGGEAGVQGWVRGGLLPCRTVGCQFCGPACGRACVHACLPERGPACKYGYMPVITVGATKGGVGKTTLAYELAAAMDGVLVDLDWDSGGATRMWGYDPTSFKRAPLLDAIEAGPAVLPRPRRRRNQPDLIPSHPDLAASDIPDLVIADCLSSWAKQWDRPVIADTHPGANALTDGAMQVADLVVVPVILAAREMDALAGMLNDFADYRLLLVPNMVPPSPPRRYVERLAELAGDKPVAPPISEHRWMRRRVRRSALTLQPNPGRQVQRVAAELQTLARVVEKHCV